MNRVLRLLLAVMASRALAPLVICFFLLLYIGIAFFTEEALLILISIVSSKMALICLFALIPLNIAFRLAGEIRQHLSRRRLRGSGEGNCQPELFDESADMPAVALSEAARRLAASGYTVRSGEQWLSAWRGVSAFPARVVFLGALFCLFSGVLISLSSRATGRVALIEGAPFVAPGGHNGMVGRISLEDSVGPFFAKTLTMDIAPAERPQNVSSYGLYPPSRFAGAFVYPRYLGVAATVRFSAPDVAGGYEAHNLSGNTVPGDIQHGLARGWQQSLCHRAHHDTLQAAEGGCPAIQRFSADGRIVCSRRLSF
jgi:hypothetical protein